MDKSQSLIALRTTILLAPLLTAACGGGGGGTGPVMTAAPATTNATSNAQPTYCCSSFGPPSQGWVLSTGLAAGPIAAPAAASFGSASPQTALSDGATFDGKGANPVNVAFPLISTGLTAGSSGLAALAASQGATATLTNASSNYTMQLVIPSANVNATLSSPVGGIVSNFPGDAPTWGYSYVVLGEWGYPSSGTPLQSEAAFVFGYETPVSAMPSSGTANYSGLADATVFKSVGSNTLSTYLDGNAVVSINFGSGKVTGAITQMQQYDGLSYGGGKQEGFLPWNDVSLSANIAAGTNKFSGTTAVTSAPGTAFSLSSSATGHIDGALYGPAAQNLGAVWSLSDGAISAFGTVGAKQ